MSEQTVVALFDDGAVARKVLDELEAAGLGRGRFRIGGDITALTDLGVPEDDAQVYAEGVRRGGALLVGEVDEDTAARALDIIEGHAPVDVAERAEHHRASDRSRHDAGESAAATGREETIPVVEERIGIAKRAVQRGRVRVHSHVVERPVEEQVNLRSSHVSIERRTLDPAIRPVPPEAFRDRTVEVAETAEEAVVGKEARVREEVVVRKDAEERTETIRDTVRHTEVEIEGGRNPADTGVGTGAAKPGPGPRPGRTDT